MTTLSLVPSGYTPRRFIATGHLPHHVPYLFDFFPAIAEGIKAWYQDNYEGKINVTLQMFGAPFSIASNLFYGVIRVYEVAALFGLHTASAASFFVPMAVSGLAMACFETAYHLWGLYHQTIFMNQLHQRKENPQEYFAHLFRKYLGISTRDRADMENKLSGKIKNLNFVSKRAKFIEWQQRLYTRKMHPLTWRIGAPLVEEITKSLQEHPNGIPQEQVNKWMRLIEIQVLKKFILHLLALSIIAILGTGFFLALAGAPPLIPLVLLSLSPLLTAVQYLYENGVLNSPGWSFKREGCIPTWLKGAAHSP